MRRHAPDVVSLVFGVGFLGLAVVGLGQALFDARIDLAWVAAVLLLVVGAAGLLGSLSRLGREAGTPRDDDAR